MRTNTTAMAMAVTMIIMAFVGVMLAEDSEAGTDADETYYCYGDKPKLEYQYGDGTGLTIEWFVNGTQVYTGSTYDMDLSNYEYGAKVKVKQVVTGSGGTAEATIVLIPLHMFKGDGAILVEFTDGGKDVLDFPITNTYLVKGGDMHVIPPDIKKEGYKLEGWTVERTGKPYDPHDPLTKDMVENGVITLRAVWTSDGGSFGGGSTTVIVDRTTYVVSFQAVNGLRYDIISSSGGSVEFGISVMDGFSFDLSTLDVDSAYGSITDRGDGRYVLSGINRNTTVTIDAERMFTLDYRLDNASVSVDGYDTVPGSTIPGHLNAKASSPFGWTGLDIIVFMDGRNVTSLYVDGGTIDIPEVTGNVVIVAESTIPWLYILIAVIVIAIAIATYAIYRRRRERT